MYLLKGQLGDQGGSIVEGTHFFELSFHLGALGAAQRYG